ncbi:mediator complex subunit [Zygosaccharomyces mellis]|uniref:Mediator complex subunit n=1 Tax=Zygosaccharomyces mellis TaxID=42258 RepID=A0A4C2DZZ6_9SACH|nr:mediator complex subunit [Zygosaccharomyces mellis]
MLGQINQIFTPEEQRALLHEAMEACKNFQKTQFGNNMTDSNRQNFIRKYINQKAIKKIQNVRLAQMAASGAAPQQSAAANAQHHAVSLQSQPSAGVGTAGPAGGAPTGGRPSNSTIPGAPTGSSGNGGAHNNSTSNIHNVIPSQGTLSVPYGQSNLRNSTDAAAATQGEAPMQQPNRVAQQQPRPSVLQAFAPTPQDVEVVKRISADAARTPLRLSDLTNTLSPQERDEIKRMLQMNQQLFAQVSNYAPQVYVFTKSENFLKEVLQLRIFVKEILEKCAKEIYVVKLDTVEKLVIKYKKYWESMKIQLLRRQQLIQQQQQLQQQKQKLAVQQQAAGNTQAGLNISQQQQRVQGSLQQIQQQMQQKQRQQQQLQQQHQQHQVQQQRQQSQQQAQKVASTNNNIALAAQNAVTSVSNPSANAASAANVSGAPGYPPPLSDPNVGVSSGSAVGMDAPKTGLGLDFMGSPNLTKGSPPAGATTGISPKRDLAKAAATSNFTKAKSNSLKPSPNASQSNANTPMVVPLPTGSASATPGVLNTGDGVSPLNGKPLTVTNHKTPSPLTVPSISQVQATASNSDNHPFEEEENALRKMNIRKAEIISRFKHRQEVFSKSPLDMFLSTLADCIGVKDSNVEAVMTIPPAVVEQVNGLGKRKLSKMAQRARDQDVVLVSIKDNNKLVMESKTNPDSQTYQIPTSALESVFKDVYGTSDIMTMNFNDPSGTSRSVSDGAVVGSNQMNARKRKLEDLEISPANSANSPSSSLMSDSKKLKVDSPEDVFLTRYGGDVDAKQSTSAELPPINVWDWNYWAKLEQP